MSNALATLVAQTQIAAKNEKAAAKPVKAANKGTAAKPRTTRKADAAKPVTDKKAANKAVAQTVAKFASDCKFQIMAGRRPTSGVSLHSYTQAWMDLTGMASGKAVPREIVAALASSAAVSYHKAQGNWADGKGGIALTAKGQNFFAARGKDSAMIDMFKAVMQTGKLADHKMYANHKDYVKAL